MHRIITERAALQQKLDDTDARLVSVQAAAEKAEAAQAKQRYELHAQLTEVHRRCEDLKAESTKNELLLQHERETGLTASDHEKRLTMQLDVERREKQALQQQLAAEAALRQKSDAQGQASSKEVQARLREVDLGAQRLQSVQAELHRSREEARQAREQLADAHARAAKMERERDAALEDGRRERLRRGELEHKAPPMERGAPQPIQVRTSGGFPSRVRLARRRSATPLATARPCSSTCRCRIRARSYSSPSRSIRRGRRTPSAMSSRGPTCGTFRMAR